MNEVQTININLIDKKQRMYTIGEEITNAITHGIGALLSIAGLVIAIVFSAIYGDAYCVVSSCIYGASLIMLYTMSTLYHSITNLKAKRVFRTLDHSSVFLLIAGTYTPYCLVTLRGPIGWSIFGVVWAVAITSIVFSSINVEKFKKVNFTCALILGWIIVFAFNPLIDYLNINAIILLIAGGLAYTFGTIFYILNKKRFMHSIWHIFVILGSALHYFSILFYVLPTK